MTLMGMEAGDLWQKLREHADEKGYCTPCRRHNCPEAKSVREELIDLGLLDPPAPLDYATAFGEWKLGL